MPDLSSTSERFDQASWAGTPEAQSVTARLGFDPMLHRPAVQVRHDPDHSPGLF